MARYVRLTSPRCTGRRSRRRRRPDHGVPPPRRIDEPTEDTPHGASVSWLERHGICFPPINRGASLLYTVAGRYDRRMAAAPDSTTAHLAELLETLGTVGVRRMFGGTGVYLDGRIVALVIEDVAYLKTDAENRPAFEERGCGPFTYTRKDGREVVVSYHEVPADAWDDHELFRSLAIGAVGAARRAAK